MPQAQLILTCSLSGDRDCAKVERLLEQYGLHAHAQSESEVHAEGMIPVVLERMRTGDIEVHMAQRIEDAAPGTRAMVRAKVHKAS